MLNHLSRWAIGDFYVQNGSGLQLTSYHLPFSIFLVFVQAVKWKTQVSKKNHCNCYLLAEVVRIIPNCLQTLGGIPPGGL